MANQYPIVSASDRDQLQYMDYHAFVTNVSDAIAAEFQRAASDG